MLFQSIPAWNETTNVWALVVGRNDVVLPFGEVFVIWIRFGCMVSEIGCQNWKPWNRYESITDGIGFLDLSLQSYVPRVILFILLGHVPIFLAVLGRFARWNRVQNCMGSLNYTRPFARPFASPPMSAHGGVRFYTLFLFFQAQPRSRSECQSLNQPCPCWGACAFLDEHRHCLIFWVSQSLELNCCDEWTNGATYGLDVHTCSWIHLYLQGRLSPHRFLQPQIHKMTTDYRCRMFFLFP